MDLLDLEDGRERDVGKAVRRREFTLQLRGGHPGEQGALDPVLDVGVLFLEVQQAQQLVDAGVPWVLREYFVEVFFGLAVLQLQQDLGEGQAVIEVVIVEFELGQKRFCLAQVPGAEQLLAFQQLGFRGPGLGVQCLVDIERRGAVVVQFQDGPGGQQREVIVARGGVGLGPDQVGGLLRPPRLQVQLGEQDLEFRDGGVFQPLVEIFLGGREIVAQGVFLAEAQVGGRESRVHAQRLVQVVDGQGAFQVGRGQADADEGLQRAVVAFQVIAEFLGGLPFFILQQQNEAELDGRLRPLAEMGVQVFPGQVEVPYQVIGDGAGKIIAGTCGKERRDKERHEQKSNGFLHAVPQVRL